MDKTDEAAGNTRRIMKTGEYQWDTPQELRTRLEMSLRLQSGHIFFNSGSSPLASAVLHPDGETLDVTILVDRVADIQNPWEIS